MSEWDGRDPWEEPRRGEIPRDVPGGDGSGEENYIGGVAGALLGALLGALPTLVTGLLGFVSGWLALLIPVGSRWGYRKLHGPRKAGFALAVTAVCSVATATGVSVWLTWPYSMSAGGRLFFLIPILFSAIGAAAGRQSLQNYAQPELLERAKEQAGQWERTPESGRAEFYPGEKKWMKPLHVSVMLSIFPELIFTIAILVSMAIPSHSMAWTMAAMGGMVGTYAAVFRTLPFLGLIQADQWVMVRAEDGTLWQAHLMQVNAQERYRFSRKTGMFLALGWSRLTPEEQGQAREAVLRAVADQSSGRAAVWGVKALRDMELKKEDKWRWKVRYRTEKGRWRNVTIAKEYEGLKPFPDSVPVEGPAPFHTGLLLGSAVIMAVCIVLGGALGAAMDGGVPLPERRTEELTARTPETVEEHEMDGVLYLVDGAFRRRGEGKFYENSRRVTFTVTVAHGMDGQGAVEVMLDALAEARKADGFDSFRFAQTEGGEDTLVPLPADNGEVYRYNIISLYYDGGQTVHVGVALMEDGTLVTVKAEHSKKKDEDTVKADVLYILESAQSLGAQLTQENYQDFFQPAEGYEYMGIAYYRAPEGMFGYDAFLDAYLPYGEDIRYPDDGYGVESTAHGMRVYQTTAVTEGDARDVVEAAYERLAASGVDIYESGTFETKYSSQYDIAYKQVAFFENEVQARVAVLYADPRRVNVEEGGKVQRYYLLAQITYLSEELADEEYPALLGELSEVFNLTLPELAAFG